MALSTSRDSLFTQSAGQILVIILIAFVQHIMYLLLNYFLTGKNVFNLKTKQAVSLIIMCSQKSSPVALAIITNLSGRSSSEKGLFAIPCVVGQLSQIFIGSLIVKRFASWSDVAANPVHSTDGQNKVLPGESVIIELQEQNNNQGQISTN